MIAGQIAAHPEAEECTIGCVLANGSRPAVPSSTHDCAGCGRLVWISQRILEVLPRRARVMCIECTEGRN